MTKVLSSVLFALLLLAAGFGAGRLTKKCRVVSESDLKVVTTDSAKFWDQFVAPRPGPVVDPVSVTDTDRPVRIQLAGCSPTGRLATVSIPFEDTPLQIPILAEANRDSVPTPSSGGIESFLNVTAGPGWVDVTRYTNDMILRSTRYGLNERGNRFSIAATDSAPVVTGDRWHWLRDMEIRAAFGTRGNWELGLSVPVTAAWSLFGGVSDRGRVAGAGYRPFLRWP